MKKRAHKRLIAFFVMAIMLVSTLNIPAKASAEDTLDIHADAAILVEASTGKVLYAKNEDTALGIASMSKMMTEYLMFEAIKDKKIKWDQEQTISDFVHEVSIDTNLSNAPLEAGKKYTIRQLYEAMAIYSANGATIAIAEAIAGSETKFVDMMNAKAKELGLKNYKFVNSTGLNNRDLKGKHPKGTGAEDENIMSAKSMAKLASRLLNDYPEVLETTSIPEKDFPGMPGKMKNWNWMLPSLIFGYEGVDGLKTGTTDFAGFCFTGTAKKNDMRVITVVMNAKDKSGKGAYESRFVETKKMMEYAFNNFSMKELYPDNYTVKGHDSLPVINGKEKKVSIQSDAPIQVVVKNGEEKAYKPEIKVNKKLLNKDGQLTAPVKKGEKVGVLEAKYVGENDYGYIGKPASANIVTAEKVDKANWFVLSMRSIGGFLGDVWNSAAKTVKGWF
ncbi:peptidase S11 D-alanyl-D-alanine carboxypeptidase 1 [Bacillus freudenreichii]|nr:peptidase S11 D-alanyl-D-alanine carboxypeptidase 1 [Bacillus freudenreichii]